MISLISIFSHLIYHRNIFGSSSKSWAIFGNLQKSSGIFEKFSGNVQQRSCDLPTSFGQSLQILGKWSEIFGKSSKSRHQYVYRDLKHRQRNGTTTTGGSKIFPRERFAHVRCCQNVVQPSSTTEFARFFVLVKT